MKIILFLLLSASAFPTGPVQQAEPDTQYVKQLLSNSFQDINQGRLSEAEGKILRAGELSESLNFADGKALAAVRLADVYLNQQRNDEVIELLNGAIKNYPESHRLIDFYNLLATAYRYKNENHLALQHYEKALDLIADSPEEEQARTTAGIRQNMASAYINIGDVAEAFENYLTAVRFSEMTGDTLFWVTALNNIGNAYNEQESYEEASFYLEKAKGIAEEKNLKNDLLRIHLNLGNTRSNQGKYEEADKLYQKALQIEQEIRPGSPPVIIYYNLGRLASRRGNVQEAENYFNQSLEFSQQINIPQGRYYNNLGLGELYFEENRIEESIRHLEAAYEAASVMQTIPFLQESGEKLYRAYRQAGDFENALTALEGLKERADSLFDMEKEQALANLENQLELDRQNERNRLLQERQAEQERRLQSQMILIVASIVVILLTLGILFLMKKTAREKEIIHKKLRVHRDQLKEANKEKDKIFAIIAHDLRSPMTSMQGILYLLKDKMLSPDEMDELVQGLESSVQQNIDAMEDLLTWAKEQLSGIEMEIRPLNVKPVVDEVITKQEFLASRKKLEVVNHVKQDCRVLTDENALKLVLRNLIGNSIKYTKEGGRISVECKTKNGDAELKISDTGIGIPAGVFGKIFDSGNWSRAGTHDEKGSGFGLNLTKEFIEKMNGSIRFESREGEGTTFFIVLPTVSESDTETDEDLYDEKTVR